MSTKQKNYFVYQGKRYYEGTIVEFEENSRYKYGEYNGVEDLFTSMISPTEYEANGKVGLLGHNHEIKRIVKAIDSPSKVEYCWPSEAHKNRADMLADIVSAIESRSATICENCGELIRLKPIPETPYCECCFNLPTAERFAVRESTKEIYFRGSHLRHGNPTDHKKPDIKLSDFLLDHEDQ